MSSNKIWWELLRNCHSAWNYCYVHNSLSQNHNVHVNDDVVVVRQESTWSHQNPPLFTLTSHCGTVRILRVRHLCITVLYIYIKVFTNLYLVSLLESRGIIMTETHKLLCTLIVHHYILVKAVLIGLKVQVRSPSNTRSTTPYGTAAGRQRMAILRRLWAWLAKPVSPYDFKLCSMIVSWFITMRNLSFVYKWWLIFVYVRKRNLWKSSLTKVL